MLPLPAIFFSPFPTPFLHRRLYLQIKHGQLNKRLRFLTSTRPNKTPVVQAVPLRLSRALRWLFNEEDLVTTRAREKGAKLDVQSIEEKKNHKNSEKQIHKPGERRNTWNPFHL